MIIFGDFTQLPPIMEKPIYMSHSTTKLVWDQFTIVVTLHTIFQQAGDDNSQE